MFAEATTTEIFPWTKLNTTGTKPSVRGYHSSILYKGQMIIFGGSDGSRKNDAWALDLNSYTWTKLTTFGTKPIERHAHSSILYNGQMVMFGGNGIDGNYKNDA